jgi:hypothetical protein
VSTSHEVSANPILTNWHCHGVRRRAILGVKPLAQGTLMFWVPVNPVLCLKDVWW